MKLSEAIRLGAMMKPQTFGTAYDGIGTCANGAARDAIGELGTLARCCALFPLTTVRWVACPACGNPPHGFSLNIGGNVAHLNDDHKWTRERIAEWVETIEAQQAVGAVDPVGELATPELTTREV